jgi:AcrR family transcriptional regulator
MTDLSPGVPVPKQRRSAAALERILDAGTEILAEGGYEAFQLQTVALRAGVSIGSIYRRATSKEALFWAIYERWAQQQVDAQLALVDEPGRWDRLDTAAVFEQATRDVCALMLDNAPFLRVVIHRSAVDPRLRARATEYNHRAGDRFKAVLGRRRAAITHADPAAAMDVAFRLIFGTILQRIIYGPEFESEQPLDRDTITRELSVAVRSYLLTPAPAASRAGC